MPRPRSSYVVGNIDLRTALGFSFGVVFVVASLVVAIALPNPSPSQLFIFVIVIALAAAGVGAILAGDLAVRINTTLGPQTQLAIRAGGAIAMFVLVLVFRPTLESAIVVITRPTEAPDPVITSYLEAVDTGHVEESWQMFDPTAREAISLSLAAMWESYRNFRAPLGGSVQRKIVRAGEGRVSDPYPIGYYLWRTYQTKFLNAPDCRYETIVLRGTQELTWGVYSHEISVSPTPCA